MEGSDIHRFSNRKSILNMCTVGNLWISEPSLGILENFKHSSGLPNIKYNCIVLFLSQLYWLFIDASKNIFFHRPPLYNIFDKTELRALHPLCKMLTSIILCLKGPTMWNISKFISYKTSPLFITFL